ncbi:MAG TPA: class I SAM-dependent methyltransferase [Candidatus Hydrogenedentes bacterium]|nr:class I SAM-dependent methyltransferase [Candidatus Hydrogenedentota bacterium]
MTLKRNANWIFCMFVCVFFMSATIIASPLQAPDYEQFTEEAAQRMATVQQGLLAPVYAPLAEQIVADYDLAALGNGIGVDLGGGSGALIIELCARTKLHWVNADINPYHFATFFARAVEKGVGHRVSAIFADGQALPFHDNYADIVVSRGTYHFIEDKQKVFTEVYRILKPGGVAYIGRGFARNMPVALARPIREKQGIAMKYDRDAAARELKEIMEKSDITNYRIDIPTPKENASLNYGIWIEMRKVVQ